MKICKPLDLQRIRQMLRDGNLTLARMGELIPLYAGCAYKKVPPHRIQDWELQRRSAPEYVWCAYAALVVDDWACDRHAASPSDVEAIDYWYGSILSPGFGYLLRWEHQVSKSGNPAVMEILPELQTLREYWKQYFREAFLIDMEHVWVEKLEDLFSGDKDLHPETGVRRS